MFRKMSLRPIFVFGSNEAGIHGAGAAKYAHNGYHAKWGVGEGLTGRAYALPTKDRQIKTLPLDVIHKKVDTFLSHAAMYDYEDYQVTRIGCGLAGCTDEEIAPMFIGAPDCCYFDEKWKDILGAGYNYWGTI